MSAMKTMGTVLLAMACVVSGWTQAHADIIYAASGSQGVDGNLYTLDPLTGAATLVGPLVDAADSPYGLTGLAFDPVSGVLYGSTANASPTAPGSLVTVDPATALVTLIGDFAGIASTMSDITFISDGTLYGLAAADQHQLYTIDPATGIVTLVGPAGGLSHFGGGSLAARPGDNVLFATPNSSTDPPGDLVIVSAADGSQTLVAALSGAPLVDGTSIVIGAADFSSAGVLFGVNIDRNGLSHLVTINTATAGVTDVGASANNLDALAIQREIAAVPAPSAFVLLGLGFAGLIALRRARPR